MSRLTGISIDQFVTAEGAVAVVLMGTAAAASNAGLLPSPKINSSGLAM